MRHQLTASPRSSCLLMVPLMLQLLLLLMILVSNSSSSSSSNSVFVHDAAHGNVKMGVKSDLCDNGETNLEKDWDGQSDQAYACTRSRRRHFHEARSATAGAAFKAVDFHLDEPARPLLHRCTNETIRYEQPLPTSGPHRPLWPVWGRYSYVPPQRWLHSLEHGGIVGLHHPCAPAAEVADFDRAVAGCLRRHVIAADAARLTPEQPFALLAFRNKVLMSRFDLKTVQDFIVSHALRGPERLADEGQYSLGLITRASIVSDFRDSRLCPDRK